MARCLERPLGRPESAMMVSRASLSGSCFFLGYMPLRDVVRAQVGKASSLQRLHGSPCSAASHRTLRWLHRRHARAARARELAALATLGGDCISIYRTNIVLPSNGSSSVLALVMAWLLSFVGLGVEPGAGAGCCTTAGFGGEHHASARPRKLSERRLRYVKVPPLFRSKWESAQHGRRGN